jgi:preprotein translocase subunit SecE
MTKHRKSKAIQEQTDHGQTDHGQADHGQADHDQTDHGQTNHGQADQGLVGRGKVGRVRVRLSKLLTLPTPDSKIKLKLKPKKEQEAIKPPNAVMRFFNFLRDAKRELTRVTWPTRKETFKSTGVLLALVAITSLYLFLVDTLVNLLVIDGIRELLLKVVLKLKL